MHLTSTVHEMIFKMFFTSNIQLINTKRQQSIISFLYHVLKCYRHFTASDSVSESSGGRCVTRNYGLHPECLTFCISVMKYTGNFGIPPKLLLPDIHFFYCFKLKFPQNFTYCISNLYTNHQLTFHFTDSMEQGCSSEQTSRSPSALWLLTSLKTL